ncbi:Hypothetical predicted protein [Podarcis lilfordi]|uniref:Ig-like domain-containing protein n=1 Tax=Podarcis lilfordi TaxID=74358 RepID=A0AA35L7I7_9SAUR|nr:Hypothetical predicted protein [Podarcis lilfordi]
MLKMAQKSDEGSYSCIVKTKDWGAQTQTVLVVESSKGNSTSENYCSCTAFWVMFVFLLLALLALAVTVWAVIHKGAREKETLSRNEEQSVKEEKGEIKEEEEGCSLGSRTLHPPIPWRGDRPFWIRYRSSTANYGSPRLQRPAPPGLVSIGEILGSCLIPVCHDPFEIQNDTWFFSSLPKNDSLRTLGYSGYYVWGNQVRRRPSLAIDLLTPYMASFNVTCTRMVNCTKTNCVKMATDNFHCSDYVNISYVYKYTELPAAIYISTNTVISSAISDSLTPEAGHGLENHAVHIEIKEGIHWIQQHKIMQITTIMITKINKCRSQLPSGSQEYKNSDSKLHGRLPC